MLYTRELYEKYMRQCGWPMAFNTQPAGFEFIKPHVIAVPAGFDLTATECGKSKAYLIDHKSPSAILLEASSTAADEALSVIDHPIMLLA